jgi:ABC-type phosphate transport system substrate-binding protein
VFIIGALAAGPFAAPGKESTTSSVAVIVHPQNPLAAEITEAELKDIFVLRRQFWSGLVRIRLVTQKPQSAVTALLCERLLHLSPAQLARIYKTKEYQGKVVAELMEVDSDQSVRSIVASEKTAIGYISEENVDDTVRVVHRIH